MKAILLVIFLTFVLVVSVNANEPESDWALKTSLYKTVALDQESIVQSGSGLQLSLYHNPLPFFVYLSRDTNQVRFAGQGGPDVNFWSLGIGMEHKLGKHLTLAVDVGWYEPKFKEMGEPQGLYSGPFAEGLMRYLNNFLMPENQGVHPYIPNWEYYSLEYKGGIGGKLSLEFEYPITEKIAFEMKAGYKYLKVQEHVVGADYDGGYARLGESGWWTIRHDRDFSSYIIGGVLVYRF
jgi:hypothetical protein